MAREDHGYRVQLFPPIHEQLLPLYREASRLRKTASYGALDIAIHSAAAYTRALTISELIGCDYAQPLLTAPLGGSSLESIKKRSMLFRFLRFKDFKLKTGMGDDIAKVKQARKIIGKKNSLRVDSNQGWTLEEAVELIPQLSELGVNIFEEPVADINELAILNKTMDAEFMADESVCTYEDGQRLIKLGAAGIWNLRLGKNGGFTGMIEMVKLAEANNIKLSLGVLVGETSVLSEASLAIAGLTDFLYTEYGFSKILLKKDPFINATPGYFGRAKVSLDRCGLGLVFLRKSFKAYKKRETSLSNGVYSPPKYRKKSFLTEMTFFRK